MDVLVILGSKSDLEKAKPCIDTLVEFKINHKLVIASAHRTPELLDETLKEAEKSVSVIIAMAGMAAHLPGVIASKTTIPVIGVPISSGKLSGVDALYSIVQMPSGYPVATVAVDGAKNAALLAVEMLSIKDKNIKNKLKDFRLKMKEEIMKANKDL